MNKETLAFGVQKIIALAKRGPALNRSKDSAIASAIDGATLGAIMSDGRPLTELEECAIASVIELAYELDAAQKEIASLRGKSEVSLKA